MRRCIGITTRVTKEQKEIKHKPPCPSSLRFFCTSTFLFVRSSNAFELVLLLKSLFVEI